MKKNKKDLWLALSAISVAATSAGTSASTATTVTEKVGVASQVNPGVHGQIPQDASRVLFVGKDIYRDETIRTDDSGQLHLMFLDQSSLTMGPNSELVINRFVYDPKTNSGELSMSAAKGVLRFVGGALSKTNDVIIKTPVGNLGIRGGIVIIDVEGDGGNTIGYFVFGDQLSGTIPETGVSKTTKEHGYCVVLRPDGLISIEPVTPEYLDEMLAALQGGTIQPPPEVQNLDLPDNFGGWMRQLAEQGTWDRIEDLEDTNANIFNEIIDNLAS